MAPGGFTREMPTRDDRGVPIVRIYSQEYINTHGMANPHSWPEKIQILEKLLSDKDGEIKELRSEVFRLRNEARRKR